MTDVQPQPDQEFVPEDDAIIGRVFRISVVVIAVIAVVVVAAVIWSRRDRTPVETIIEKDPGTISAFQTPTETIPDLPFTDITAAAGIDFVHQNGAVGEKMLPETMGSGAAFLDYDADGDADLLLVNGSPWPWDDRLRMAPITPALYRNDGTGSFDNVTAAAGLGDVELYGTGVACGDYDGDGLVDVYIAAVGTNRLFRNTGSRFEDVTDATGVAGDPAQWSTSSGFFDADGDGDLDLFVCNYVRWTRDIDLELNYTLNGTDRAYGPPTNFGGDTCTMFRNDGDGTFTDFTEEAGLVVRNAATGIPVGKSLAFMPFDFDDDGDLDVVVANDTTQNFFFANRGDGTFEEIGARTGIAFDGMGASTGAMGIDAAWFRNDEEIAVGIGNFANEMTSFYVKQDESLQFSDDAIVEGIGSPSRQVLSFGLLFFDADLDGRVDLLQANGHLEEEINEIQSSQHYRQAAQLFWNRGPDAPTTFAVVPAGQTGDLATPIVGRGATCADIDGDGDLDVLLTQTGDRPRLLRNDQSAGHHWLAVRLEGAGLNRDAIGATVELTAGGVTQRRLVMPTRSYLSQIGLPVTFGLGAARAVDTLRIRWPDGVENTVPVEGVDRVVTVRRQS